MKTVKFGLFFIFLSLLFLSCTTDDVFTNDSDKISQTENENMIFPDYSENDNLKKDNDLTQDNFFENENNLDNNDDFETPDSSSLPFSTGIYSIKGKNENNETFSGKIEVRTDKFVQIIKFDTLKFKNKFAGMVFEGKTDFSNNSPSLSFKLNQVGFVVKVDNQNRDLSDIAPVSFFGIIKQCGNQFCLKLSGKNNSKTFVFDEVLTKISDLKTNPIWKNQRVEIPQLPEPSDSTKNKIKQTFASFYKLDGVKPYTKRDDFNKFVHYMIVDKTDYDFYQTKPDYIRVIQKTLNNFSLAEAWMRSDAYGYSLKEKEEIFSKEIDEIMINPLGMVAHKRNGIFYHDGDALIWTGVYVAALAMKYKVTHDENVLKKMLKSLNGIIACLEITPDPSKDFARTIRVAKNDGNKEFHKTTVNGSVNGYDFSQIEYKENGNNDMSKGPFIGFLWAYDVLKDKAEYKDLIKKMTEALKRMREHHPVFKDKKTNQTLSDFELATFMSVLGFGYADDKLKYKAEGDSLFSGVKQYFDSDLTIINEYGVSDWSGNHLTLWSFYNFQKTFELLGDSGNSNYIKGVMNNALNKLKYSRTGLFQLILGGTGLPFDKDSVDDAIWRIKEIPLHRGFFQIDWTINPHFCISPIPALPWKNDWTTSNRIQSLRAYPLFQYSSSSYYWKDNILGGYSGGGYQSGDSAIDFFIAYWYAVSHKFLTY